MKKRRMLLFLLSFTLTIVIAVGVVWVAEFAMQRLGRITIMQNREVITVHEHLGINPNIANIVLGDQIVRTTTAWAMQNTFTDSLADNQHLRNLAPPFVREVNGEYIAYVPVSFLQDFIDPFIFWDEGAGSLFISTRYDMLEFTPDRLNFYVNGQFRPLNAPILREGGEVFLPAYLVEMLYPLAINFAPEYNIIAITDGRNEYPIGEVRSTNANVRHSPNSRTPIATQLVQGNEVIIFGEAEADYLRIRTATGVAGYILASDIIKNGYTQILMPGVRDTILQGYIDNLQNDLPNWGGGGINLVWEHANNQTANANRMQVPFHESVTVVSPSWFELSRDNMGLVSAASREYVDWAHEQGVYVWANVFDLNHATVRDILTSRSARRTVIEQLVHSVHQYNLDGIIIHFEHLSELQAQYKIQFLRELSVAASNLDIVLSAMVLVPAEGLEFYRRDLIALTVDFVMLMAYNEHRHMSTVSGPVASLPWVRQAVEDMLQQMPAQQVIMGIPFFNRVWRETLRGDTPPQSLNWGMDYTRDFFNESDAGWDWDEEIGSYYSSFLVMEDVATVRYRVWLEDENSINEKMQIFAEYNLAGVGGWRRLHESEGVWEIIASYF